MIYLCKLAYQIETNEKRWKNDQEKASLVEKFCKL